MARVRGGTTAVRFSPDGSLLLLVAGNEARVLNAATFMAVIEPIRNAAEIQVAEFSADGKDVFTASSAEARLWDSRTGQSRGKVYKTDRASLLPAAISPDCSRLAITVVLPPDPLAHRNWGIQVFDAASGKLEATLPHTLGLEYVAFASDNVRVLTVQQTGSNERTFHVWDSNSGKETIRPIVSGYQYAFSPASGLIPGGFSADGKRLVVADSAWFTIYDAQTGRALVDNKPRQIDPLADQGLFSAEFTAEGKRVYSPRQDGSLWDADTGKPSGRAIKDHVFARTISADGRFLLGGFENIDAERHSRERGAAIWDLVSGQRVQTFMASEVAAVAFSPDENRVAIADATSGETLVWEVKSLRGRN
ncbi:MAG TPA: WD40 repeat domain-containing protein [Tepidisphaeraceae bacterium]|nr:WD40 repeat domain-containing protein [Tepidisphaeraceae bacterium]